MDEIATAITAPETKPMRTMNTDQKHLPTPSLPPPAPSPQPATEKAGSLDLSVPKVAGGALAAMTTAALGSQLGVAGTLVGAAIASVIAAVATSLYTASLRHTGERLRTVIPAGRPRSGGRASSGPASMAESPAHHVIASSPTPSAASLSPSRRLNWAGILVGAVAAFALAAVAVTGIELASGRALSGDEGTTIGQVSDPAQVKAVPTADPTPDPTVTVTQSSEPEPSPTETQAPQETPSPTVDAPEPSASVEPSASASSAAPRPSASASASASPSAPSASPSAAAPTASGSTGASD